jgi:DNA-binding MarR family transcriptional regulator
MTTSIQVLLRNAHDTVDAENHTALAQNGFADIKPWHHTVLRNLGEDGSRPSELATRGGISRQAVTKIVDELERLDLVRRDPDPDDRRGVIVRYSDRGRAGLDLARKRMLELEAEFAERVGAKRWADARAVLETLFDDVARTGDQIAADAASRTPRRTPSAPN